ncbi:MAG: S1 family peptidase, partial [Candidatus Rokuibacteriota bacterium]
MMRRLVVLALAVLAAGCAPTLDAPVRADVMRSIVSSTVQLRLERAGIRRAASGVVLAADPRTRQSWILTTRHFLAAWESQPVSLISGRTRTVASVTAVAGNVDLAVLEVQGVALPAVTLKATSRLGDEVWVVSFPWGRRLTVKRGIVSQIAGEDGEAAVEGPARMVDVSVHYGASGGGVYDAATGELIGIVEGYRTARMTSKDAPSR